MRGSRTKINPYIGRRGWSTWNGISYLIWPLTLCTLLSGNPIAIAAACIISGLVEFPNFIRSMLSLWSNHSHSSRARKPYLMRSEEIHALNAGYPVYNAVSSLTHGLAGILALLTSGILLGLGAQLLLLFPLHLLAPTGSFAFANTLVPNIFAGLFLCHSILNFVRFTLRTFEQYEWREQLNGDYSRKTNFDSIKSLLTNPIEFRRISGYFLKALLQVATGIALLSLGGTLSFGPYVLEIAACTSSALFITHALCNITRPNPQQYSSVNSRPPSPQSLDESFIYVNPSIRELPVDQAGQWLLTHFRRYSAPQSSTHSYPEVGDHRHTY